MEPLHDALAFARELRARMADLAPASQADAADAAGVSRSTFTRAMNGDPNLSHENYLRLRAWLDAPRGEAEKMGRAA